MRERDKKKREVEIEKESVQQMVFALKLFGQYGLAEMARKLNPDVLGGQVPLGPEQHGGSFGCPMLTKGHFEV